MGPAEPIDAPSAPVTRRDAAAFAALGVVAALLRITAPWSRVVHDGYISFQGDAWYHMRVVDHLLANFPHRLTVDPFVAEGGQTVNLAPALDYLTASLALLVGLGQPSPHTIDIVGALLPPVLGACAVVLTALLALRFFGRIAGAVAGVTLAAMPGPFLDRTLLGATDHHTLEALLTLGVILALARRPVRITTRPGFRKFGYPSAVAGLALGLYFLSWTSAPFFVATLAAWLVLEQLLAVFQRDRVVCAPEPLALAATVSLSLVWLLQNPALPRYPSQLAALTALLLLALLAMGLERAMGQTPKARLAMLAMSVLLGLAGIALVVFLSPETVDLARSDLRALLGREPRLVLEARPLFVLTGQLSWLNPTLMFGPAFYLALPALLGLTYRAAVRQQAPDLLLAFWAWQAFIATLAQNRFGYYLAPVLAMLLGWTATLALGSQKADRPRINPRRAVIAIATLVFLAVTARQGLSSTAQDDGLPVEWHRALTWLRQNSPAPFPEGDLYASPYSSAAALRSAYSVEAWWDYGYWVTRVARRVPISNPTQWHANHSAFFYLAEDDWHATTWLDYQRSRYVIVDRDLVMTTTGSSNELHGKFQGIPEWITLHATDYFEPMFMRERGSLKTVWVFHPRYYRTMAVRLYWYGTNAATPADSTWVIRWVTRTAQDGRAYKEIVESRRFATFDAADAFNRALPGATHAVVGLDPARTPVPLDALSGVRHLHDERGGDGVTRVRVFERASFE